MSGRQDLRNGRIVPGPQELFLIALVALFVLGPERLPDAARSAARMLAKVRRYGVSATQDLKGMADLGELESEVQELRRELNRTRTELRRAVRETVTAPRLNVVTPVPASVVDDAAGADPDAGAAAADAVADAVPDDGPDVDART